MAQDLNRKLVVEGLLKVEKSGFSNLVLQSLLSDTRLSNQDKAFISNLFYGTIERKITLNYILSRFISKPLKKLDKEVVAIMQSGLYQILYMNSVPSFAAINQAVGLCSSFKKTSAKGETQASSASRGIVRKDGSCTLSRHRTNPAKTASIQGSVRTFFHCPFPPAKDGWNKPQISKS